MTNLDHFFNRASVRAYSSTHHVTDEELNRLLDAAAHAPSTGNMQLYSVVVTRDTARKEAISPLHFNQPAAKNCDALLTFCADVRRFGQWCESRQATNSLNNAGGRLTAMIDATIFAQQFVCAAEQSGIGCCYLGTVTYNLDGFRKALELPDDVIPLFSIAVGYPVENTTTHHSDRLPLSAIVHSEVYHDATSADIDSYYSEKESLDESKRFIEENGKHTLAQVYSEIRYPRDLNERVGIALLKVIED